MSKLSQLPLPDMSQLTAAKQRAPPKVAKVANAANAANMSTSRGMEGASGLGVFGSPATRSPAVFAGFDDVMKDTREPSSIRDSEGRTGTPASKQRPPPAGHRSRPRPPPNASPPPQRLGQINAHASQREPAPEPSPSIETLERTTGRYEPPTVTRSRMGGGRRKSRRRTKRRRTKRRRTKRRRTKR